MKRNMNIAKNLLAGGVGIIATDTLYGLVGSALRPDVVERIYALKSRQPSKPLIVLISKIDDLALFDIKIDAALKEQLSRFWPGPVSIILPCRAAKFKYLHRGTQTLAFRLPAKTSLRRLMSTTGPLVAPSANPEGLVPALTIKQARSYFGQHVDFYQAGQISGQASRIIKLESGNMVVVRP